MPRSFTTIRAPQNSENFRSAPCPRTHNALHEIKKSAALFLIRKMFLLVLLYPFREAARIQRMLGQMLKYCEAFYVCVHEQKPNYNRAELSVKSRGVWFFHF